jgi:excisionase family DNA binding protein
MPKITKEQAAEILGARNVRTVERHVKAGRLSVTYEKGKTRDVPMYDEDEVKALAAEQSQPHTPAAPALAPTGAGSALATRSDIADNVLSQLAARLLDQAEQRHAARALPTVDIGQKVMLTLADAAALSSLSEHHLREAIRGGKLKGKIIGRGYKIKRTDLDAYVNKL